ACRGSVFHAAAAAAPGGIYRWPGGAFVAGLPGGIARRFAAAPGDVLCLRSGRRIRDVRECGASVAGGRFYAGVAFAALLCVGGVSEGHAGVGGGAAKANGQSRVHAICHAVAAGDAIATALCARTGVASVSALMGTPCSHSCHSEGGSMRDELSRFSDAIQRALDETELDRTACAAVLLGHLAYLIKGEFSDPAERGAIVSDACDLLRVTAMRPGRLAMQYAADMADRRSKPQ